MNQSNAKHRGIKAAAPAVSHREAKCAKNPAEPTEPLPGSGRVQARRVALGGIYAQT